MLNRFESKFVVAAASGAMIPLVFNALDHFLDDWNPDGSPFDWVLFYGLPAGFFAAGLFWPYLRAGRYRWARWVGIIAASAFSYWAAMRVTVESSSKGGWFPDPGMENYILGSAVGTAIVLLAAWRIVPLGISRQYWILGAFVCVVSGALFGELYKEEVNWDVLAYGQWHALFAITLHYGVRQQ